MSIYEGCSLILVTCLIIFPVDNQIECCSYVVKAQSFLIRLISKLLLSDAWSYSNRILKQGTVMTLRCFSVDLQYVISILSIEKAITFATVYTGPLSFYTLCCHSYKQQKTLLQNIFTLTI